MSPKENNPRRKLSASVSPSQEISPAIPKIKKKSLLVDVVQMAWPTISIRKIFRSVVSVGCMGGFVFQTFTFLTYYFRYPTVVDVQVKRPEEMELPSITFCKRRGIIQENNCVNDPSHCVNRSSPNSLSQEELNHSSQFADPSKMEKIPYREMSWSSLLLSCETYSRGKIRNCKLGKISYISVPDEASQQTNCYTLFSKMNSLQLPTMSIPKRKKLLLQIMLSLNPDTNESSPDTAGQMAIHSPYTLVNPFNDGFVVRAGSLYILQLSLIKKNLLAAPYDTNCMDYLKLWRERGGNGPLSHQMCMEYCILTITLQKFNCTAVEILYPHSERICQSEMKRLNEENFSVCHSSCPEACSFTVYEYEIQERKLDDRIFKTLAEVDFKNHFLNETTALQMYLKRPEILTFTHRPQFQFVETFSYIGGLLGIWLGISLVAILDFLECLIVVSTRFYKRFKVKSQRRSQTHVT